MKRKIIAAILAFTLFAALSTTALANQPRNVTATLDPGVTIALNGQPQGLRNAQGENVFPIVYAGTTFIPIRAVSNMLGLQIDWHPDGFGWATGRVVHIQRGGAASLFPPAPAGAARQVQAVIDPGISILFDGALEIMRDAQGNQVFPLVFEGTTYLPVRAVALILGIGIDWDGNTRTVNISS